MVNRKILPSWPCRRIGLLAAAATGLAATALAAAPALAQSDTLYKLDTKCSVKGGEPQACVIEAVNEGSATLYRHIIGKTSRRSASPTAPCG